VGLALQLTRRFAHLVLLEGVAQDPANVKIVAPGSIRVDLALIVANAANLEAPLCGQE